MHLHLHPSIYKQDTISTTFISSTEQSSPSRQIRETDRRRTPKPAKMTNPVMHGRKIAAFASRPFTPYPKTPSTFGQRSSIPIDPYANSSDRCVIWFNDPSTTGSEIHKSSFWKEGKNQRRWFRWINLSTAHPAQRRRFRAAFSRVIDVIFWWIWFLVSSSPFGLVTTTPCGPFPMSRERGWAQRLTGFGVLWWPRKRQGDRRRNYKSHERGAALSSVLNIRVLSQEHIHLRGKLNNIYMIFYII